MADQSSSDGGEFPPAGTDLVYHELRVRLDIGKDRANSETVKLFGKMLVERGDPFVNDEGLRQIDFRVLSWEASGWSRTLQQGLTYVLSEDVEQPVSRIVAEQKESDFPATFEFNVIFDARANNQLIFRGHHGRPKGHGFRAVPPAGIRRLSPTITEFEDTLIEVDTPLGPIRATPLDCNDQKSRTLATR
jgi:hypothetical protein